MEDYRRQKQLEKANASAATTAAAASSAPEASTAAPAEADNSSMEAPPGDASASAAAAPPAEPLPIFKPPARVGMSEEAARSEAVSSWIVHTDQGIEVSPLDDRTHRYVSLPNGLRAIVSSDPSTEKASAALAVMVGASADPLQLPGLAHFCEHMLFLGTEKYPEENAYKKYLSAHGGKSNASTSYDRTVFQFDVGAEHFQGALDIFAQFFVAPLFTQSATDRELNAVDSEDSKNRCNDGRRLLQVSRALAIPGHPYGKFSTGNLRTLREDAPEEPAVRDALLAFHAKHYFAPNMRLAVCGREAVEELKRWVVEGFSAAPGEPRPPATPLDAAAEAIAVAAQEAATPPAGLPPVCSPFAPPVPDDACPMLVEVAPLRELRSLRLAWCMPSMRCHYRSNALNLFSHLLGHEGEGSVFAELQDMGWATALSAGTGHQDDGFSFFDVNITLTLEGENHIADTIASVLEYCELLRRMDTSTMTMHWEEMKVVSALSFRFQQKSGPYVFAQSIAKSLTVVDHTHVFSGGRVYDNLDPAVVHDLANRLVLQNLVVRFASQSLQGKTFSEKERWYDIPFSRKALPKEICAACERDPSGKFYLPAENKFIPDDLSLRGDVQHPRPESPVTPPVKLCDVERGRLWHKMDDRYAQPRLEVSLLVRSPAVGSDLTIASLLVSYMSSRLKQSTYAASIAGLQWSASHSRNGIQLNVSGYSQRAPYLLEQVIESLLQGPWDGESTESQAIRFEALRERLERRFRSWPLERPDAHASYWTSMLLKPEAETVAESLAVAEAATLDEVKQLHSSLKLKGFTECLIHGNSSSAEAVSTFECAIDRFQVAGLACLQPTEFPQQTLNMLREGQCIELHSAAANSKEENCAVHVYFQAGELSSASQAALRMVAQVLRQPCFNELRTQQQLGYIVSSGTEVDYVADRKIEGLTITVVSKQFSAVEVLRRIDEFLSGFRSTLEAISDAEWAKNVEALATKLLEPPKTLSAEASRHWALIRRQVTTWDWREELIAAARSLSVSQALVFYDWLLASETRRRVNSLVHSNAFPLPEAPATLPEATSAPAQVLRVSEEAFVELRAALPRFGK